MFESCIISIKPTSVVEKLNRAKHVRDVQLECKRLTQNVQNIIIILRAFSLTLSIDTITNGIIFNESKSILYSNNFS